MKGSVFQRGPKWSHKFRVPQRDPATGKYAWVTKAAMTPNGKLGRPAAPAWQHTDLPKNRHRVGWILLVIGLVLSVLGRMGRPVGGRRYWY